MRETRQNVGEGGKHEFFVLNYLGKSCVSCARVFTKSPERICMKLFIKISPMTEKRRKNLEFVFARIVTNKGNDNDNFFSGESSFSWVMWLFTGKRDTRARLRYRNDRTQDLSFPG